MQAKSLPALIVEIARTVENPTPGGVQTESRCLHLHSDGAVVWALVETVYRWQERGKWYENRIGSRIVCYEIEGDDTTGWTASPLKEADSLRHVTCPLEFLEGTAPWSAEWRDRVWEWHEAQLTKSMEAT